MLLVLDLTPRQAARVLEQAVRTKAKLELEPRPESTQHLLWGSVAGRDERFLRVDLHDRGETGALAPLIGAFCEVRTILSGQLYLFTTCVVDVIETTVPQRLVLALPDTIQLTNRRRFVRRAPAEPVVVQLQSEDFNRVIAAELSNIGASGLACRVTGKDADDVLFVGDDVQLRVELPWAGETFDVGGVICTKSRAHDGEYAIVGVEFVAHPDASGLDPMLERLRLLLSQETDRLTEMEGDL